MATKHSEMLEFTKYMQAGYFYVFDYKPVSVKGSDLQPVIYCAYAPPATNTFTGINFHYFPDNIKIKILQNMDKVQNILSDDIQHIFDGSQLNKCFTNIGFGMREYNKKRVLNCYRIKNKYVPEFLKLPSKYFMSNDTKKDMERDVMMDTNKGF